jgi:hypothetical protein
MPEATLNKAAARTVRTMMESQPISIMEQRK